MFVGKIYQLSSVLLESRKNPQKSKQFVWKDSLTFPISVGKQKKSTKKVNNLCGKTHQPSPFPIMLGLSEFGKAISGT